ncbi:MAG TPA: biosynthetic peptidoglycan transglycosylase [Myxococcota bacterium]|nr:biosynthetic peptidoglycan transglycosylase [Myxococcota bacterium]
MRSKLVAALVVLVVLCFGALEGAWFFALKEAEQAGVDWVDADWGVRSRTLYGVRYGPALAEEVELEWGRVTLRNVEVDVLELKGGSSGLEGESSGLPPVEVVIEGLVLRLGERELATLSGHLNEHGQGKLRGEGSELQVPAPMGARARLTLEQPVEHEHVNGTVKVIAVLSDPPVVRLQSDDLVVQHELLSTKQMALPPLKGEFSIEDDALAGVLSLGELPMQTRVELDGGLHVQADNADAGPVFAVFADIVPELRWAHVEGEISFEASYSLADGSWTLEQQIHRLGVSGAVKNLGTLRGGPFTYAVRDPEGNIVPRECGEGSEGWTPIHRVSDHLLAAIIAAEDSAYYDHTGYSQASIDEALQANIEAGEVVRGGSTLTQQLAKNLFLDGERTMERKLREMVIAVELDRALGKRRVLELYVNVVEWGPEMWGVEAASDRYFLRQPEVLPPNEAAFLAALLPDPRGMYTQWYLADRASHVRIDWILENMANGGHLTEAEAASWAREPLRFVPPPK